MMWPATTKRSFFKKPFCAKVTTIVGKEIRKYVYIIRRLRAVDLWHIDYILLLTTSCFWIWAFDRQLLMGSLWPFTTLKAQRRGTVLLRDNISEHHQTSGNIIACPEFLSQCTQVPSLDSLARVTGRWLPIAFPSAFSYLVLLEDIFCSQVSSYSVGTLRKSIAFANAIQVFSFGMLSSLTEQKLFLCTAIASIFPKNTKAVSVLQTHWTNVLYWIFSLIVILQRRYIADIGTGSNFKLHFYE